jgi:Ribbon-helix-helix protein, copG family
MIRIQTNLCRREYDAARREAKRLGISMAELLRQALRAYLPAGESKPWMRYAGMVATGDSSEKADCLIYGQKD